MSVISAVLLPSYDYSFESVQKSRKIPFISISMDLALPFLHQCGDHFFYFFPCLLCFAQKPEMVWFSVQNQEDMGTLYSLAGFYFL